MSDPKFKKKRTNRKLASTSEVLQSLLQNSKSPLSHQFKRWKLWQNWGEVVGPTISKYSEPVHYSQRLLIVWVKNSVQLQELLFVKKAIVQKINEYMGNAWVRDIRFTLNKMDIPNSENDSVSRNLDRINYFSKKNSK